MRIRRSLSKLKREVCALFFGGRRPDFLIVGAQKSGTTSLFSYLDGCNGFVGSRPKEVHFFDREDNFSKGANWYEAHFSTRPGKRGLFFEASPEYLCREKVPERVKAYNADLKIIILLREPVSRLYSAWNMYRQWSDDGVIPWGIANDQYGREESPIYSVFFRNECPSFSDYIKLELQLIEKGDHEEEPSLIRRGLYMPQIKRYVDLFGWDNVLVLGFNELKNDSEGVIRKCHEFLGVSYVGSSAVGGQEIKNKRTYPSSMKDEDIELLHTFYQQPNKELFHYLGFQPDW
jgi:hypothetical protein